MPRVCHAPDPPVLCCAAPGSLCPACVMHLTHLSCAVRPQDLCAPPPRTQRRSWDLASRVPCAPARDLVSMQRGGIWQGLRRLEVVALEHLALHTGPYLLEFVLLLSECVAFAPCLLVVWAPALTIHNPSCHSPCSYLHGCRHAGKANGAGATGTHSVVPSSIGGKVRRCKEPRHSEQGWRKLVEVVTSAD